MIKELVGVALSLFHVVYREYFKCIFLYWLLIFVKVRCILNLNLLCVLSRTLWYLCNIFIVYIIPLICYCHSYLRHWLHRRTLFIHTWLVYLNYWLGMRHNWNMILFIYLFDDVMKNKNLMQNRGVLCIMYLWLYVKCKFVCYVCIQFFIFLFLTNWFRIHIYIYTKVVKAL